MFCTQVGVRELDVSTKRKKHFIRQSSTALGLTIMIIIMLDEEGEEQGGEMAGVCMCIELS